jgi:ribosomal protein S5
MLLNPQEDLIPSHLQFRVISIQRVVNQTGGGKVESFAGMVAVGNCMWCSS